MCKSWLVPTPAEPINRRPLYAPAGAALRRELAQQVAGVARKLRPATGGAQQYGHLCTLWTCVVTIHETYCLHVLSKLCDRDRCVTVLATGLRTAAVTGGVERKLQVAALARRPQLLVATPGRLLDLLDTGAVTLGASGAVAGKTIGDATPSGVCSARSAGATRSSCSPA